MRRLAIVLLFFTTSCDTFRSLDAVPRPGEADGDMQVPDIGGSDSGERRDMTLVDVGMDGGRTEDAGPDMMDGGPQVPTCPPATGQMAPWMSNGSPDYESFVLEPSVAPFVSILGDDGVFRVSFRRADEPEQLRFTTIVPGSDSAVDTFSVSPQIADFKSTTLVAGKGAGYRFASIGDPFIPCVDEGFTLVTGRIESSQYMPESVGVIPCDYGPTPLAMTGPLGVTPHVTLVGNDEMILALNADDRATIEFSGGDIVASESGIVMARRGGNIVGWRPFDGPETAIALPRNQLFDLSARWDECHVLMSLDERSQPRVDALDCAEDMCEPTNSFDLPPGSEVVDARVLPMPGNGVLVVARSGEGLRGYAFDDALNYLRDSFDLGIVGPDSAFDAGVTEDATSVTVGVARVSIGGIQEQLIVDMFRFDK